ncbi:M15 family metallopeptidase [Spirochaeta isovalerica]|uniref:Peptidase M15C domain-containing protein n=1 Tax=Spirochaeta isovalerica TaxID=150 RepID=A0A841RG90_9SPIO|nr:M15 family metallopeptidase [Spirochaeta isovalerica]MBB6482020.1 hypothetical protein [Spirochaeta isovalerica]
MKKSLLPLFTILIAGSCFSTGSTSPSGPPDDMSAISSIEEPQPPPSAGPVTGETGTEPFPPNRIITALKEAYPDKIKEITYKNNDWAIKVYDRWLYWADGRLLPEEEIYSREEYSPHLFYRYPAKLPSFSKPDSESAERIDSIIDQRKENPILRNPAFLNGLWRIWDRDTSWKRVKTTFFLGYKLQIHRDLLEDLARVEEEIQRRMLVDRELAAFVRTLSRIDGYNWRQIADTDTLSVHSYGIAIDLILNRTGGKQIYWLWTLNSGEKFYDIPYNKRFSPPESFIEAFEKEGFVWGGKWLFYDTIHFEYRPEIMILNDLNN